ncbi:hypothetical protein TPHA_0M01640 [Tetrapisispora phaffii CBS 4417]|uniref:Uncharacterized protein n=1 Tax=Tetrapisispora phaffii (strain ATCC 24235 / CBS 4417 / NBRC 1672 / NRRL Y-8282 / UCD 70-5) TaxID=1071381 RepID=G8C0M4_TETPH|nr:hypothetical protein TPHA_0M01640 [Tetrapisispora phaffii CBS 4417]CCE65739.1 hypothetical protein TPHA_0M01640 [Tetrapisispora phaffii CBS 4417]
MCAKKSSDRAETNGRSCGRFYWACPKTDVENTETGRGIGGGQKGGTRARTARQFNARFSKLQKFRNFRKLVLCLCFRIFILFMLLCLFVVVFCCRFSVAGLLRRHSGSTVTKRTRFSKFSLSFYWSGNWCAWVPRTLSPRRFCCFVRCQNTSWLHMSVHFSCTGSVITQLGYK